MITIKKNQDPFSLSHALFINIIVVNFPLAQSAPTKENFL